MKASRRKALTGPTISVRRRLQHTVGSPCAALARADRSMGRRTVRRRSLYRRNQQAGVDRTLQSLRKSEQRGAGNAVLGVRLLPFRLRRAVVDDDTQWPCSSGQSRPGHAQSVSQINDGAEIGRIVVIDAESNSVPFLKGLQTGAPPRAWVTRLRPSLLEGKRIFNRTNYRPYRDGDRVRMGLVDLHDPEGPGQVFRVRVIEVDRSKA